MIKSGGQLRLLFAIFVRHHILPSQYAKLNYVERAFVRASVIAELEEESRARR